MRTLLILMSLVMMLAMSMMVMSVYAILWSDPAGHGMGWYDLPSEFSWNPAMSNGADLADNLWTNRTNYGGVGLGTSVGIVKAHKKGIKVNVELTGLGIKLLYNLDCVFGTAKR